MKVSSFLFRRGILFINSMRKNWNFWRLIYFTVRRKQRCCIHSRRSMIKSISIELINVNPSEAWWLRLPLQQHIWWTFHGMRRLNLTFGESLTKVQGKLTGQSSACSRLSSSKYHEYDMICVDKGSLDLHLCKLSLRSLKTNSRKNISVKTM